MHAEALAGMCLEKLACPLHDPEMARHASEGREISISPSCARPTLAHSGAESSVEMFTSCSVHRIACGQPVLRASCMPQETNQQLRKHP